MSTRKVVEPRPPTKSKVTFYVDRLMWQKFGKIADDRGHTRTWYLTGCVRETVEGQRRELKKRRAKRSNLVQ